MKVNISTTPEPKVVKQVKINESTRKHTLEIYKKLVNAITICWENGTDIERGKETVSEILFQYHKKEGKEAVKLILEDDMDVFKNGKKHFRVYAQTILSGGKELANHKIKINNEVVARLVTNSEKMTADFEKSVLEHPMGTGMKRIENEIRYRPKFMMEDLKFKLFRTIGIY